MAYNALSARTSTPGAQFIGEVRMTAREVCAPQPQACNSISVICGMPITVREMRAPQLGACMADCEVRAPQPQAHNSTSVICGVRITVCEVCAPQLLARNSLVRCA